MRRKCRIARRNDMPARCPSAIGRLVSLFLAFAVISPVPLAAASREDVAAHLAPPAVQSPRYNVTAPEWIDELYNAHYLSVLEIDISFEFDIHKISIMNWTGIGADDVRLLYAQDPGSVITALNQSSAFMSNLSFASTFGPLNGTVSEPAIVVDRASLEIPFGGDRYNPPIAVYGNMKVDILPATFNFINMTNYNPADVISGILRIGAEIKLPLVLFTQAGHNQTVVNHPPTGINFGDGTKYYGGLPVTWNATNWEGDVPEPSPVTLAMKAISPVNYRNAKVSIDALFDFEIVEFYPTGETNFSINLSITTKISRISVNETLQKYYSKYFLLKYLNADFLRFLFRLGFVTEDELKGFVNIFNELLQTGIYGMFPDVSNITTTVEILGLKNKVEVAKMEDAPPLVICLNSTFNYIYKPGKSDIKATGLKLYTIKRTFAASLPGPLDAGWDFMGEGKLNYTFRMPKNVIIFEVYVGNKPVSSRKGADGKYSFTVTFSGNERNKSLRVVFGADVEYSIEPLIPYIILIFALVVVWAALFASGRRKKREEEEENRERLYRGEPLEDDEE